MNPIFLHISEQRKFAKTILVVCIPID